MANKVHHVESLEANKAACGVVFPWEKTTRWNETDCPACREVRPTQNAVDLPYRCSECGADRGELEPCPSCGAA